MKVLTQKVYHRIDTFYFVNNKKYFCDYNLSQVIVENTSQVINYYFRDNLNINYVTVSDNRRNTIKVGEPSLLER